jgi:hypothetical protein
LKKKFPTVITCLTANEDVLRAIAAMNTIANIKYVDFFMVSDGFRWFQMVSGLEDNLD